MDGSDVHDEVWRLIERGHHGSALSLITKKFASDATFINQVARWYLDKAQWVFSHGYEYFLYAYALVPLGLSQPNRESLLSASVKWGFHNHAARLAAGLGRQLTIDEVQALVHAYAGGSFQSCRIEADLKRLAWDIGGELLESRVRRDIATMHVRWQREGLLY